MRIARLLHPVGPGAERPRGGRFGANPEGGGRERPWTFGMARRPENSRTAGAMPEPVRKGGALYLRQAPASGEAVHVLWVLDVPWPIRGQRVRMMHPCRAHNFRHGPQFGLRATIPAGCTSLETEPLRHAPYHIDSERRFKPKSRAAPDSKRSFRFAPASPLQAAQTRHQTPAPCSNRYQLRSQIQTVTFTLAPDSAPLFTLATVSRPVTRGVGPASDGATCGASSLMFGPEGRACRRSVMLARPHQAGQGPGTGVP